MRLLDRVCDLFLTGIRVEDRHLKLTDISSGRAGEEDDIFQIYLTTEFLDGIDFPVVETHRMDLMEKVAK